MSDTPETGANILERRRIHKIDGSVQVLELVDADFSRKLERERDQARGGKQMNAFQGELEKLINKHSMENTADMPDFLLAEMICRFIQAVGASIKDALDWHGCDSVCHPAPNKDDAEKELPREVKLLMQISELVREREEAVREREEARQKLNSIGALAQRSFNLPRGRMLSALIQIEAMAWEGVL